MATRFIEKGAYFKIKKPRWSWQRIGGLREAKDRLEEMVSLPLRNPEVFRKAGLTPPHGILLWGPPGGGKTVLAEAAARSAGCSYIAVKAIEIMSEPEEIRVMYETAAELAPTVIFVNEVDALAPKRDAESIWAVGITRDAPVRIAPPEITEIFYEEMDRASKRRDIITIGGTYRPDVLDPLSTKKGRMERKIYVPPPDLEDRKEIIRIHLKGKKLGPDISVDRLAEMTEYYVGADILGMIREATVIAIREGEGSFDHLTEEHFIKAMKRVPPSLSPQTVEKYNETLKQECEHCYLF
ncbi:MAG: AAA family ATPase [Methanobacteriota archaeon]|nr:MAG: AAA family ATPase [Euryarchaeota archaeon]